MPPTVTPAPAKRLFTEEFESGTSYWTFLQAGNAPEPIEGRALTGALRLSLDSANEWAYGLYEPFRYANVRVDAAAEFGTDGKGAAGLICRYDPSAGWYEFNIHSDQTYSLLFGTWLAEGVAHYTPLVIAQSEAIRPGTNEISLVCQDDVLTPYVNGVQLRKRLEKTYVLTDGQVGVTAGSFEDAPLTISYDWLSVSEP